MKSKFDKLSDIAEVIDSLHKTPKYSNEGQAMVRCTDVKYGKLDLKSTFKVNEEVFKEFSRRYTPSKGDIIITRVGSYGITAIVDELDFCLGQNTSVIIPKNINARYLYLALNSTYVKNQIEFSVVGSTQKTLSLKAINNLEIPRFEPNIEDEIAKIGGELDDKIELNAQTNQTLEQIAQTIFKSWFVDFDPVKAKIETLAAGGSADDAELAAMRVISAKTFDELNSLKASNPEAFNKLAQTASLFPAAMQDSELGEIPERWEVGKLANIIDFNPRRTLKKGTLAPYLDMKNVPTTGHLAIEVVDREMASGTKFVNGDTLLARITPCLENGKTAYVDFLKDNQVGWGSTEYIVMRPKEGYPTSIGYLLARDTNFRQQAIQSMTGTSGRQRADAKALAETAWLIYPKELVRAFDKTAKGYLSLAKINGDESKSLSEIRDALLPKLLSGELVGE
ncbi:restriction endonuclease subunit S [Vibrio cholerae]|nr:restriction endonuclease subunit S [Vibrio cholerae]